MKPSVRVFFWLFCGAAAAAAPDLNRNARFSQKPAGQEVQEPAGVSGVSQEKQSFHEPLTWRFPDPPAEEAPRFPPEFELKVPPAADSVAVFCGENSVRVEASRDLLGIGRPVRAADVTLGGCPATGDDPAAQLLVFESELHGCGSRLLMSEDSFVYVFTLLYTPSPLGNSQIIRTPDVSVSVQCQYQRKHDVSSELLKPTWTELSLEQTSEENLYFSLRLMTDDWQFPRPSAQFSLGDVLRFEVSVKQFHHVPLRVTVDDCVATLFPNVDTVPRYAFLGNNGCLFDSQLTGSSSHFLSRVQDDKLRFEMEAFRFQQDDSGVIYITCNVRATAAAAAVDATNKACSFSNGWSEASGRHQACSCCDTRCGAGSKSHLRDARLEHEASVGPIRVEEKSLYD